MFATPKVQAALHIAAMAHQEQKRKVNGEPYIVHPVTVAFIVAEFTDNENTLSAALMHDVLEDQQDKFNENDMREFFGDNVTDIVIAVTKDDSIKSWRRRNESYLKVLRASFNGDAVLICAADKISNLTTILRDYNVMGEEIWTKFNAGKVDQLWWYGAVLEMLQEIMPEHKLTLALEDLVRKLSVIVHA